MEEVYQSWRDQVEFYLVYHYEPHPGQGSFRDVEQPKRKEERIKLASKLRQEAEIEIPILIDEIPVKVSKLYGGLPNMIYIIGPEGKIVYCDRWTDAEKIDNFLKNKLKRA